MISPDMLKELTMGGGELRSFSSVGGYPIFYLDENDGHLCPECATEVLADGETLSAAAVNWESMMCCEICSGEIESAYGVPGEDDEDIF